MQNLKNLRGLIFSFERYPEHAPVFFIEPYKHCRRQNQRGGNET